jgi:hypothetical protein
LSAVRDLAHPISATAPFWRNDRLYRHCRQSADRREDDDCCDHTLAKALRCPTGQTGLAR